jgi:glycosyltransferase involved in cell wall biosynthesis
LRIILAVRETSAPYNQFSLSWADEHDITICTYFGSAITPSETITLFEGDGSPMGFFRALKAALDAKEYDIIHAHSPHVAFLFVVGALSSYRKLAPSTVVTVHDSYQNFKLRNRLLWIPVFATFRRIVCCGQASFNSFPALYKWLAGERLCAVPNGLDIARVDRIVAEEPRPSAASRDFTVLAVSRLVDIKNPGSVLSAFQQCSEHGSRPCRLVYIGDGPLRESLQAQSWEAGLQDEIELTGLIPREKVFERMLGADLFISASRGEGLPVAVLEAMACGCPVLLSDIPPHREIAEGVDFIPLKAPDDVVGFAHEIERLGRMPAAERANIGQKCRKLVEERFSLQAMHAGYTGVYAQITNGHVSSPGEVG